MRRFLVWGTGAVADRCWMIFSKCRSGLLEDSEIIGFVDNDVEKKEFHGQPVIVPSEIQKQEYDYICIWTNNKNEKEIRKQIIDNLNIPENRILDIFSEFKQKLYEKYANSCNLEVHEMLSRIEKRKWLEIFYYERSNSFRLQETFYDSNADLFYTLFEGKRMYLKRSYKFIEKNGVKYCKDMWEDQDSNSPHLYEDGNIKVEYGDVVVDAGVCEGNFSLHNIDKAKKIYLIECDKEWMEALRYTFFPYRDKVVFCSRFLSDRDSEKTVCLDTLVKENVDFIKMDIEGEEVNALKGAGRVLKNSKTLKCAICAYHRHGDEDKIVDILHSYEMKTEFSKGFMLFLWDKYVMDQPELRRGIVRGIKGL